MPPDQFGLDGFEERLDGGIVLAIISVKVAIQQVRRDVELMVAICRGFVSTASDHRYTVPAHQSADTPMPDIQANLLQLFSHAWPTIAAQAET